MRALPLSVSIVAAVLAASATAAWACSCLLPRTADEHLQGALLVVVARAEWTRPERGRPAGHAVTRFAVDRTLKGRSRAAWQVAHHRDEATCGTAFVPGRPVILIARAEAGRLATGLCDRAVFPLADDERALADR